MDEQRDAPGDRTRGFPPRMCSTWKHWGFPMPIGARSGGSVVRPEMPHSGGHCAEHLGDPGNAAVADRALVTLAELPEFVEEVAHWRSDTIG